MADLWEKYGDTSVATWEEGDSRPTKQRVYAVRLFSPSCLTTRRASSSCFLSRGLSASALLRFSLRQLFSWPDLLIYELPSQSTDAILLSSSPSQLLFWNRACTTAKRFSNSKTISFLQGINAANVSRDVRSASHVRTLSIMLKLGFKMFVHEQ